MTVDEARQLPEGTIVMWDGNPRDPGTVQKVSATAFFVIWENGQQGWIDHCDAEKVETCKIETI